MHPRINELLWTIHSSVEQHGLKKKKKITHVMGTVIEKKNSKYSPDSVKQNKWYESLFR